MTNANMISHLSWSTISYDWEWRDQGGLERQDVQTRNDIGCDEHGQCRDTSFIIAQTTGQQAGTVPIAIDSGLRGPNCTQRPDLNSSQSGGCIQWLTRTHFATCLVQLTLDPSSSVEVRQLQQQNDTKPGPRPRPDR